MFSLIYIKSFIVRGGKFNIVFFELKILKYYLNNNMANVFGSSLMLFLSGYFKSWWGNKAILRDSNWSIFWVIGLVCTLISATKEIYHKRVNIRLLISSLPIIYLVYLGAQAPFSRYFLLILPFIYTILSQMIFRKFFNPSII